MSKDTTANSHKKRVSEKPVERKPAEKPTNEVFTKMLKELTREVHDWLAHHGGISKWYEWSVEVLLAMQRGQDEAPLLFNSINAHTDKGTQLLRRLARLADISALLGQDMTVDMLKDTWKEGMSLAAILSDGQCRLQYHCDPTHQLDGDHFDPDEYFDESGGLDNIDL